MSQIAIVTGAGRLQGIGAAICRELAKDGIDIFFTYWTNYDTAMFDNVKANEPQQLQEELLKLGIRCSSMQIDLSDPASAARLFDAVESELGSTTILVNNACYSTADGYEQLTAEVLDAHYAVNLRAAVLMSVEFAKRFQKGVGGRIINLTSGQSLGPMTSELAYAITKGAVDTLTQQFAAAVADKGITVNAVNPGPTDSGWITDDFRAELLSRFPLGRIGEPRDVARLIKFLTSADADWVTGQIIHSEGGFCRG